jgi:hypothetical protein
MTVSSNLVLAGKDAVAPMPCEMQRKEVQERRTSLQQLAVFAEKATAAVLSEIVLRQTPVAPMATPSASTDRTLNAHSMVLKQAAERAGIICSTVDAGRLDPRDQHRLALLMDVAGSHYYYYRQLLYHAGADGGLGRPVSGLAAYQASNKHIAKGMLRTAGIPTPNGALFAAHDLAGALAYAAGRPGEVCVKPNASANGRQVFPWLRTADEILKACVVAAMGHDEFIVEDSVPGEAWRFFYAAPRIVGVKVGRPASLLGDGIRTVGQLYESWHAEWMARKRHTGAAPDDDQRELMLRRQGLCMDSIPPDGARVFLSPCSNGSLGAESLARPDAIHPDYVHRMLDVFNALPGLCMGAADVIVGDPRDPAGAREGFCVLEINAAPSLLAYHYPQEGPVQDVAGAIITMLINRVPGIGNDGKRS